MQVIKNVFIILYTLILGFMVFCNTSVFAEDIDQKYKFVNTVSNGYDMYWINTQDNFDDFVTRFNNKSGNAYFLQRYPQLRNQVNYFTYVAIPLVNVPDFLGVGYNNNEDLRGYVVYIYSSISTANILGSNQDFTFATFNDFYGGYYDNTEYFDNSFSFNACKLSASRVIGIWNYGENYTEQQSLQTYIPLCVYNYYHHIYYDFVDRSSTSGATQITGAINNQTNTIKNESAKVTSAIQNQTQATKEQTNQLLDTNNTGNETMSVNDTTTDSSANLGGLYNQIDDAFTSDAVILYDSHTFNLTLPNGDSFPIVLRTRFFRSFLDSNPVFKAFYQSIFWVIFGGYVIFDFKKIINKMKEGNIDNVVGSSNPVDSVVNMSLK